VKNGCPTSEVSLSKGGEIIVGKFVDRERADYRDLMHDMMEQTLGDRYVEREACECEI
jgi:2-oxoglutarate ferredoxin oxidoreductase subunit beta